MSFTLTPNHPWDLRAESLYKLLDFWGIYTGFVGWYSRPPIVIEDPNGLPIIIPGLPPIPIHETIEQFVAMDRVLLMNYVKDFTDDREISLDFYSQCPIAYIYLQGDEGSEMAGKQILVIVDVESLQPNEVQLFVNGVYVKTESIYPRNQIWFMLHPQSDTCIYRIVLRPTKFGKGMYFNDAYVRIL